MRFAALGALRGWRGAEPLDLGPPQRQAVLAALLLRDGRAATIEAAILAHDGQGRRARDRFAALPSAGKASLVAFLRTL